MTNHVAALFYFILLAIVAITMLFARLRDGTKQVTKHLIRLGWITIGWQAFAVLYFLLENEALALWAYTAKLVFTAFSPVQLLVLSFSFYTAMPSRKTKFLFGMLCIIPAITALLAVTTHLHPLLRSEIYFVQLTPLHMVFNARGPWFWVHTGYSYLLMVASICYILFQHAKLPKGFRMPSVLVVSGTLIALISSCFVVFTPLFKTIDVTLVGISLALICIYAGISISDESSLLVQAFDNIFAYLEEYVFILNANRFIIEMNPAARNWLRVLGIGEEIETFDELNRKLQFLTGGADMAGELDYQLSIGQEISHYDLAMRPIIDQTGRTIGTFAIFTDITRYKLLIERIEQSAITDPLTNLGNRQSYEKAVEALDDPSFLPLSAILGDVNHLKAINDNYGHATGDALLRTIAQVLRAACPEGASTFRIGGDEFLMLLPHTSTADAETIAGAIRNNTAQINENSSYTVSIALGVATKETVDQNLLECISLADRNMYTSKQHDRRIATERVCSQR